jgi:predicted Zn-dependent protease
VVHTKAALAGKVDHLLGLKHCDCVMNSMVEEAKVGKDEVF